jgi:hypothetical protein
MVAVVSINDDLPPRKKSVTANSTGAAAVEVVSSGTPVSLSTESVLADNEGAVSVDVGGPEPPVVLLPGRVTCLVGAFSEVPAGTASGLFGRLTSFSTPDIATTSRSATLAAASSRGVAALST